jgi:hypothetical protein
MPKLAYAELSIQKDDFRTQYGGAWAGKAVATATVWWLEDAKYTVLGHKEYCLDDNYRFPERLCNSWLNSAGDLGWEVVQIIEENEASTNGNGAMYTEWMRRTYVLKMEKKAEDS